MQSISEDLKKLSRCDLVAHDFVKLALGKRLLFTMPARGAHTDPIGFTHCNGISFLQNDREYDHTTNYWDECCLRGLAIAQIARRLGLSTNKTGWLVDASSTGRASKEFRVHMELMPVNQDFNKPGSRAHVFYLGCLKTVGKDWFEKMVRGTRYEHAYRDAFTHAATRVPNFVF